ncbi:hypothetical protein [Solidesulfovibrio sp. C21]|uniref:hypothetical protein n=1 Tax=Solidesulfovibrio sp. C21 TaxID=3398613 RepID=UPI0039FC505E
MKYRQILIIALALCLGAAAPALAHRVNVFAYVEGNDVHVECSYSRSDRVRFGEITVKNAVTGQVYLTGKTDDKGNFVFPVPEAARKDKTEIAIHLDAGEGHQNNTTVKAEEYLSAAPAAPAVPTSAVSMPTATPAATAAAPASTAPAVAVPMDQAALRAVVEQAVEVKIAPIRKMLLDQEEKGPGLAGIAGGIGWLVGIAGLLAYVRCRKGGRGA